MHGVFCKCIFTRKNVYVLKLSSITDNYSTDLSVMWFLHLAYRYFLAGVLRFGTVWVGNCDLRRVLVSLFKQSSETVASISLFFFQYLFIDLAASGLSWGHMGSSLGPQAQLLCDIWDLSSPMRGQTHIPCTARPILNHWATREVSPLFQFYGVVRHRFCFEILSLRKRSVGSCSEDALPLMSAAWS